MIADEDLTRAAIGEPANRHHVAQARELEIESLGGATIRKAGAGHGGHGADLLPNESRRPGRAAPCFGFKPHKAHPKTPFAASARPAADRYALGRSARRSPPCQWGWAKRPAAHERRSRRRSRARRRRAGTAW